MRKLAAVMIVLGSIVSPLIAQEAPEAEELTNVRKGFWISFGFGPGFLAADCDGCDERETGFSGYLRLGGTINQQVLIGGGTTGWYKSEDGIDFTAGAALAHFIFYPMKDSGFYIDVGVGGAWFDIDAGPLGSADGSGGAFLGGLGYDLRLGKNFSVTFWGDFLQTFAGEIEGFDVNFNRFAFGAGVTWH